MPPFTPFTVSVVRIGGRTSAPTVASHSAEPVYIDEISPAGELLQSFALPITSSSISSSFSLSLNDEREGDLDTDFNGCTLSIMGYTDVPDGHLLKNSGVCPCSKNMSIALIRVEGLIDTSTSWFITGNADGGPGYVRPDGAQLRPDGLLYAFAGQSGSCFLDLIKPSRSYNNSIINEQDRSVLIDPKNGFSARGIQIAGQELDLLQLYAGSGSGLYKIGDGLPSSGPSAKKYIFSGNGGNEGGSFDFQNDTFLYIVDQDADLTSRSLHRYICTPPTDPEALNCPEGGTWKNDTSFDLPCVIDGEFQSLWYIAGFYDIDPERPMFFATTHGKDNSLDDVGTNRVVRLDVRSGECTVMREAQQNTVYRGVSLSPNPQNCPNYSPSASPSPSPSASSTLTASATSSASASSVAGAGNSAATTTLDVPSSLAITFSVLIPVFLVAAYWWIKLRRMQEGTSQEKSFTFKKPASPLAMAQTLVSRTLDSEEQKRLTERSSLLLQATRKS